MSKKITITWLFLGLMGQLYGQTPRNIIDSLLIYIKQNPQKAITTDIYSNLSWYYNSIHVDSALYYGTLELKLATSLNDSTSTEQAFSDLGVGYFVKGDIDKSLAYYKKALDLRIKERNEERIASLNLKIGSNYYKKMELEKAMSYFLKALNYYDGKKIESTTASLEYNIAIVYTFLKNYNKALYFLNKSKLYFKKTVSPSSWQMLKMALETFTMLQKSMRRQPNILKLPSQNLVKHKILQP